MAREVGMATRLTLRALTGQLRGQEIAFSSPAEITLGRSSGCAVQVAGDATVSRQHCLIELSEDGAWVLDLGSLNGTFVTGQKIGRYASGRAADSTAQDPCRHPLHDGDELRVGSSLFAVVLSEGMAPAGAPAGAALAGRAH